MPKFRQFPAIIASCVTHRIRRAVCYLLECNHYALLVGPEKARPGRKTEKGIIMRKLQEDAYFQGYMTTFSPYPAGDEDDPWEDIRIAYEEVGSALWEALHTGVSELEEQTRGTKNEQAAQDLGKSVREAYRKRTA